MNLKQPHDLLSLEPRALTILLTISRFPEGVTINQLNGLLAMSYRTIRTLCKQLSDRQPPLLDVRRELYNRYILNQNVNLNGLSPTKLSEKPVVIRPNELTKGANHPILSAAKLTRKRPTLRIGPIRIARLSLKGFKQKDLNNLIKDLDSLSSNNFKSSQRLSSKVIENLRWEDLHRFKSIQISSIRVDEFDIQPAFADKQASQGYPTNRVINLPSLTEPNSQPVENRAETAENNIPEKRASSVRRYLPPDESRRMEVRIRGGAFDAMGLVLGRRLRPDEVNPRHNQQYLLHSSAIFEHTVLWHPQFGQIPEKTVLGWLAQALEGSQRGKITQPWGIVYRGLLGELPSRQPDKRFRDEPERVLGYDFLSSCGYHLEEDELPPTPEQVPTWQPPAGRSFWEDRMEEDQKDWDSYDQEEEEAE